MNISLTKKQATLLRTYDDSQRVEIIKFRLRRRRMNISLTKKQATLLRTAISFISDFSTSNTTWN